MAYGRVYADSLAPILHTFILTRFSLQRYHRRLGDLMVGLGGDPYVPDQRTNVVGSPDVAHVPCATSRDLAPSLEANLPLFLTCRPMPDWKIHLLRASYRCLAEVFFKRDGVIIRFFF